MNDKRGQRLSPPPPLSLSFSLSLPCMTRMQTCLMCWSLGSLPWKKSADFITQPETFQSWPCEAVINWALLLFIYLFFGLLHGSYVYVVFWLTAFSELVFAFGLFFVFSVRKSWNIKKGYDSVRADVHLNSGLLKRIFILIYSACSCVSFYQELKLFCGVRLGPTVSSAFLKNTSGIKCV